ncbi:MAG: universal stress protein [Pseudomonadota bacterium]
MTTVLAAIDGSIFSQSVASHAAWSADRLSASVELMQVLGRREQAADNRSGRLVAGARRQLLEELVALDAQRSKLLMKQARLDLEEMAAIVAAAGVEATTTLRHGDLLETLASREEQAELIVVGKRGQAADFAKLHLGSNLERILRGASRPVLVAARAFSEIRRFMIAFDGRAGALASVEAVSRSALFHQLDCVIAMAGDPDERARRSLDQAAAQLSAAGLAPQVKILPGPAKTAIPAAAEQEAADLLVMGAYGRSRLRTLVIGGTTSEVIRESAIPVLIYK